jgi:hypothetical protein
MECSLTPCQRSTTACPLHHALDRGRLPTNPTENPLRDDDDKRERQVGHPHPREFACEYVSVAGVSLPFRT